MRGNLFAASERGRWTCACGMFALSLVLVGPGAVSAQSKRSDEEQQQLQQDPILIKSNQGLPNTLFIAPWKKVRGKVPDGTPLESSVEQKIEPVDRDVLRRELDLYEKGYSVE